MKGFSWMDFHIIQAGRGLRLKLDRCYHNSLWEDMGNKGYFLLFYSMEEGRQ